jgi:hypothetical protein
VELARHEAGDILLRLPGGHPRVRGQDDVGQAAQLRAESRARGRGLLGEHVDGGARDPAGPDRRGQRLVIDRETARQVEQQAAGPHPGQLGGADQSVVLRPLVHVQRHDVRGRQQLRQRAAAARVAQREPVGDIEIAHRHAQRLGQHGHLAPDAAVPDDAEAAAPHLVRAVR